MLDTYNSFGLQDSPPIRHTLHVLCVQRMGAHGKVTLRVTAHERADG